MSQTFPVLCPQESQSPGVPVSPAVPTIPAVSPGTVVAVYWQHSQPLDVPSCPHHSCGVPTIPNPWLSPMSPAVPIPPVAVPNVPCCPLWLSPGSVVAAYRKLHLFDAALSGAPALRESSFTNPGRELLPPVPTPVGKVWPWPRVSPECPLLSPALADTPPPQYSQEKLGLAVYYRLQVMELVLP